MSNFTLSEDRHTITLRTDEIELSFGRTDGCLRVLRRRDGPNVIGHGAPAASLDVAAGLTGRWQAEATFVRYLHHAVRQDGDAVDLVIAIGIGPLKISDHYRITGTLIARRVAVENVGPDMVQLLGVRLILPWARIGPLEHCRFEAPGNSVRPRLEAGAAAQQRRGVMPQRYFAPGLRRARAFEPVPTGGAGLLALCSDQNHETVLCWYYSETDVAWPELDGNDHAVHLIHRIGLEGWLAGGTQLESGTQYILLVREYWPEALAAYQRTVALYGMAPVTDAVGWIADTVIYEVHPAMYGGFRGLSNELPRLADLGVGTLYLMPIWRFASSTSRPWDGNWGRSGSPYAILDLDEIDPTLGEPADLRALVDAAHTHGMRVLLELPAMTCGLGSRIAREHPEWLCRDQNGAAIRVGAPGDNLRGITHRFDCAQRGFQDAIVAWAVRQVEQYGIDGFRVDAPLDGQPNWARGLSYHAGASPLGVLQLLRRVRSALRAVRADAALLVSRAGPGYAHVCDAQYDELVHHMFVHLALGRMTPAELSDWMSDHAAVRVPGSIPVGYTETHDTRDSNPLADGLRGSRIARMILVGMVGCGLVPLLRAGQESGDTLFLTALLDARRRSVALRHGTTQYGTIPCNSNQVFAAVRSCESERVLTLLNVGPHRHTVTLSLPVDLMGVAPGYYRLHNLVMSETWHEDGVACWDREALLSLQLTLDPFAGYLLGLEPSSGC